MLGHTELPGFPPPLRIPDPGEQPTCVQCDALIVPDEPTGWSGYQQTHLDAWKAGIPPCNAAADQEFPDPLGKSTDHDAECGYKKLPPVVMWFMDEVLADAMLDKLKEARRPCTG